MVILQDVPGTDPNISLHNTSNNIPLCFVLFTVVGHGAKNSQRKPIKKKKGPAGLLVGTLHTTAQSKQFSDPMLIYILFFRWHPIVGLASHRAIVWCKQKSQPKSLITFDSKCSAAITSPFHTETLHYHSSRGSPILHHRSFTQSQAAGPWWHLCVFKVFFRCPPVNLNLLTVYNHMDAVIRCSDCDHDPPNILKSVKI